MCFSLSLTSVSSLLPPLWLQPLDTPLRLIVKILLNRCPAHLQAAADTMLPVLKEMPTLWPKRSFDTWEPGTSGSAGAPFERQRGLQYSGIGYSAQWGRYWELPCGSQGVRVRAAQLQHRLPCWGYVFEEMVPAAEEGEEEEAGGNDEAEARQSPGGKQLKGAERGAAGLFAVGGRARRAGRKVVILGDTISSHALAPLALGCDIISHEATFMTGEGSGGEEIAWAAILQTVTHICGLKESRLRHINI